MAWVQLEFRVDAGKVELLSEVLSEAGAIAVTLAEGADQPLFEPAPGETPLWSRTRVSALFPEGVEVAGIVRELERRWTPDSIPLLRSEAVAEQDWERAWMAHFKPLRFGSRLWICPSWLPLPDPGATNILLDPGLAFGTGTHPTTALCLEWLTEMAVDRSQVIDYGCGSGILAIAALKLGAARAWAIDHDPQALLATRTNAERNGVGSELHTRPPSAPGDTEADLLIANILADPLLELASTVAGFVRPGGRLALAGITEAQTRPLVRAYSRWFSFQAPIAREGWALLIGCRR